MPTSDFHFHSHLCSVYTCMHACTHTMDTCTHRDMQAHICIITTEGEGVGSTLERPTQLLGLVRIWINILGRYTRGQTEMISLPLVRHQNPAFLERLVSCTTQSPLPILKEDPLSLSLPSPSLVFRTSWSYIKSTVHMSCKFSILCNFTYMHVLILVIHCHSPLF